ncbi:MAG: dethiobiotin synthase [Gammaproteobacteria bacterium]|nr:dethiobiotin synthase [Gammaproteobacteria bacterium]
MIETLVFIRSSTGAPMGQDNVYFVTGTDTGVGKTFIAGAILRAARTHGLTCVGYKPIAAGATPRDGALVNEDALQLIEAAGTDTDYAEINPVVLRPAIAPHIALGQVDRLVTAGELAEACPKGAAFTLVEGAGGWLVPLNERETLADVCAALSAKVILVIAMKLGCLNHALLTADAIENAGLKLGGWVANSPGDPMPFLAENVETLRQRLAGPCLGVVPHLDRPEDAVRYLDLEFLWD